MKIYFVRHAQSVGNAGGEYDRTTASQLTELGRKQAEALAERLMGYGFDEILVSPLERTVRTILPYLKKTDRKAEVWPELVEARGRKDIEMEVPEVMRMGAPIELPEEALPYLVIREDEYGKHLAPGDENAGAEPET